jgi:galactokinase
MALRRLFMPAMNDADLLSRLTASHAEFFNGKSRMTDYLAMMNAKKDHFLIVDQETLEVVKIKNPFAKHKILIFDSRVPLIDVDNELKIRLNDLKTGLEILSQKKKGKSLKDFTQDDLDELMGSLNEDVRRRCLFVMQERERIKIAAEALLAGDKDLFAKTLYHSHEGLRDLYEASCPETDWLVKRASEQNGVLGSRMTGKGFGGCVYIIIQNNVIEEYEKRMDDYERIFGFRPVVYEVKPAGGAKLIAK